MRLPFVASDTSRDAKSPSGSNSKLARLCDCFALNQQGFVDGVRRDYPPGCKVDFYDRLPAIVHTKLRLGLIHIEANRGPTDLFQLGIGFCVRL